MVLLQDIQQNLWVTIVITLFILSLISERLANLIKLYFQSWYDEDEGSNLKRTTKGLKGVSLESQRPKEMRSSKVGQVFGNLRYRQIDPNLEKLREKGVQTVAVLCGVLVAIFAGADLFVLIQTGKTLDWQHWFKTHSLKDVLSIKMFSHALGAIFAGFFISLGSKFWHDILDFVLYSSNLKRKLSETNLIGQIDRIEQFDEFLRLYPSEVAQLAIEQWNKQITEEELPNVLRVNSGVRRIKGEVRPCLYVYLKDNDIPTGFQFSVEHRTGFKSPVEILFIPRSAFPKPHLASGDTIIKEGANFQGTLCCMVKNDFTAKIYALTCRHVMDSVFKLVDGEVALPKPKVEGNGQVIGIWDYQVFNSDYDVALIELDETNITSAPYTQTPYVLDQSDIRNTQVTVITRGGIEKTGVLVNVHINRMNPFDYAGQIHEFEGLLEVATTDDPWTSHALTHEGDSGAMVYDSVTKKPLGMIIGGSLDSSFAIPIQKILNKLVSQIHIPT